MTRFLEHSCVHLWFSRGKITACVWKTLLLLEEIRKSTRPCWGNTHQANNIYCVCFSGSPTSSICSRNIQINECHSYYKESNTHMLSRTHNMPCTELHKLLSCLGRALFMLHGLEFPWFWSKNGQSPELPWQYWCWPERGNPRTFLGRVPAGEKAPNPGTVPRKQGHLVTLLSSIISNWDIKLFHFQAHFSMTGGTVSHFRPTHFQVRGELWWWAIVWTENTSCFTRFTCLILKTNLK